MDSKKTILAMVTAAAIAGGTIGALQFADSVEAAPGDLTVEPKLDPTTSLAIEEICLSRAPRALIRLRTRDGIREVIVKNSPAESTAYSYATDATSSITIANGFQQFRTALGITNATATAASAWLRTNNVVTGTTGAQ